MAEYAAPRRDWTPGGGADDLAAWYTQQLRQDPNFQVPRGYRVLEDGTVKRESPHWMGRNPWIYPVLGVAGGLGAAGLSHAAGAGAAGGAASATGAGIGETGAVTGLAGSGFGAAAGAGGGLGGIIEMIAKIGGPAAITALTRRGSAPNQGYGSGGPLDSQLNEIMALAKRRMERTEPVHEAAMNRVLQMQPGTASYGRVQEASQNAMQPTQQAPMNPQVLEAFQRLMQGNR